MKRILIYFIIWRLLLIIISVIAVNLIPLREGFLGGGTAQYLKNPLVWGYANMDGVHYLSIAKNGYFQFEQAFFPFFPLLIRFLGNIFNHNYLLAGLLISNLSAVGSVIMLYKLIKMDYEENISRRSVIFFLIFPAAFFLVSIYTESFFLLLVLFSFYFFRRKNYLLSGIFGALASFTRLSGVFLFPALLIEWWLNYKAHKYANTLMRQSANSLIRQFLSLSLIPLGLIAYMFYLYQTTHDPLYFFHVQPSFGANRSGGKLILLPQVLFRYLKIFFTARFNLDYAVALSEFLIFCVAGFLLIKYFKKLRPSYLIYAFFSLITPTLTGSLSSLSRYSLTVFPLFICLALTGRKSRAVIFILSLLMLIFSAMYFFRGYFIA